MYRNISTIWTNDNSFSYINSGGESADCLVQTSSAAAVHVFNSRRLYVGDLLPQPEMLDRVTEESPQCAGGRTWSRKCCHCITRHWESQMKPLGELLSKQHAFTDNSISKIEKSKWKGTYSSAGCLEQINIAPKNKSLEQDPLQWANKQVCWKKMRSNSGRFTKGLWLDSHRAHE